MGSGLIWRVGLHRYTRGLTPEYFDHRVYQDILEVTPTTLTSLGTFKLDAPRGRGGEWFHIPLPAATGISFSIKMCKEVVIYTYLEERFLFPVQGRKIYSNPGCSLRQLVSGVQSYRCNLKYVKYNSCIMPRAGYVTSI